ncbi:extracellular solute-binding protein [Patescibacteria group bacterium]|nr:extracellular solute-binding protein [Patescibacteria group bacterium]
MKPFPTIVAGIFVVFALVAVVVFATFSSSNQNSVGQVLIWGSVPEGIMRIVLETVQTENTALEGVTYQFVREEELIPNLVAAIAAGKGPDLVIFPAEYFLSEKDKLIAIPYSALSKREFQDTFVEAGEIFLSAQGSYGLPFVVDPLVMYWNRNLFANAGIGVPPKYWDEVASFAPKLSRADERGTLSQSAVAFGTWENVSHAKAITVTLFRQLGNSVVSVTDAGPTVTLVHSTGGEVQGIDSALRFYTDFSDPVKSVYSWNSSQSDARTAFIGGRLAMYFGRASELGGIRQSNPNLNFDVASVPHMRGGSVSAEAKVLGLSIPRGSRNQQGALAAALALTSASAQNVLQTSLSLPTSRRDGGSSLPDDPYFSTFRNATLTAFPFPDPDPDASDSILRRMVENVTSGENTVSESISNAQRELRAIIRVQ